MIYKWLNEYNININFYRKKRKCFPDKNELIRLHYVQKLTLKDISELYDVSDVLVGLWFKENNIDVQYYSFIESNAENEIRDSLNACGFNFEKVRGILENKKLELDCYDKNKKIAIEYCGLRWHSNELHDRCKNAHLNKLKQCNDKGIQLITIFEDEWLKKKEIVLSVLKSKLGKLTRLFARKFNVDKIDFNEARVFLEKNHIQGKVLNIKYAYGLYDKHGLVGVMTFGPHPRGKKILVLSRLCFKNGYIVIGGAEKLFKRALKDINEDIISWSDKRWSEGKVYLKMGFDLINTLPPDYSYVKKQQRFSKQSMKKNIVNCPKDKTEIEFNKERGFSIIWDCGKDVWLYKNKIPPLM